jgi:predicted transcriptional regulator
MRETSTFTVSLPPAMAKQIEKVMKTEHRTRSELVREALRVYFTVRVLPNERPTAAEARAYRRGMAAYKRGDYATLERDRSHPKSWQVEQIKKSLRQANAGKLLPHARVKQMARKWR